MAQGGELVPACPLPGLVAQLTSLCLYPVQLGGSGCEQDFAPGLGTHCALFPTLGSFAKLFAGGLRDVREACLRVKAAAQRRRKDEQWTEGCEFLASGKKTNVGEKVARRFLLREPTLSRQPLLSSRSEGRGQTAEG